MSKKLQSDLLLLLTAMIWGSAFVAQKAGATLEPFTYNGIRNLVGAIALVPVILIFSRGGDRSDPAEYTRKKSERKTLIKGGIACGIALGVASSLQQFGLYFDTDAGKAGFITTLYIVIVPVLGLFLGKRVRPIIWLCVLMGAVGFYFLTMAGKGCFVAPRDLELVREDCLRRVEEHLSQAVDIAKGGGITLAELTGALNILYGDE